MKRSPTRKSQQKNDRRGILNHLIDDFAGTHDRYDLRVTDLALPHPHGRMSAEGDGSTLHGY